MPRPNLSRVPEYYHKYIAQVTEDDLMTAIRNHGLAFTRFLQSISPEKREYRYAGGKWTIREVLQHIIDAERIFAYRALRFARKDATPLPGFDENIYTENSKAGNRNWEDLVEEFKAVRRASELLFGSFDEEQMDASGIASEHSNYVAGIGFIIVGHVNHHIRVISERYLKEAATT